MRNDIDLDNDIDRFRGKLITDPYKLIALAVVNQAIKDRRQGSMEALNWLLQQGHDWIEICSNTKIDYEWWEDWVVNKRCRRNI